MSRNRTSVFFAAVLTVAIGLPAFAQETVTLTGRAVEGGVNREMVEWLNGDVFPAFEAKMKSEGRDVDARLIEFGGSDEQLRQQYALDLSVGTGADILAFDGFWVPEFAGAGYIAPLDEIAGPEVLEWEGWSHIPTGLQELLGFDGSIYGLGNGTDVRMLFYRKDVLQAAGIELPWQPESWADVLETARTLKKTDPDVTPLQINAGTAMGEATTMQGYFMLLLGTGVHMYNFDTGKWVVEHPGILGTLELYKTIYVDEELGDSRFQLLAQGRDQTFEAFRDGEIAILAEGDWFWRSVVAPGSEWEPAAGRGEVVGWAKMPAKAAGAGYGGNDYVSISGGTGFIMNPNTDHPDLTWELLSFMFSREMQLAYQDIQPRIRIRDDVPVVGDPQMSEMAAELLDHSTIRPQLPAYARVSVEAQRMTERVITGEMTPEQAMAAYAEAVIDLVGEENVERVK